MKKSTVIVIFFLAVLALFLGYAKYRWIEPQRRNNQRTQTSPSPGSTAETRTSAQEKRAAEIASQLSDEQKIAQLFDVPLRVNGKVASSSASSTSAVTTSTMASPSAALDLSGSGFMSISGSRLPSDQVKTMIESAQNKNKTITPIPIAITIDHEGGSGQRLTGKGFTLLPAWSSLCTFSDPKMKEKLTASAQELHAVGINIIFGPAIDLGGAAVSSSSANHEAFSVSPTATGSGKVAANLNNRLCSLQDAGLGSGVQTWVKTYQDQSLFSAAKYFSNRSQQVFQPLLKDNPDLFVITAIRPSTSGTTNQLPCGFNAQCLNQISDFHTRLVFTEAIEDSLPAQIVNVSDFPHSLTDVVKLALEAGNTVVVFGQTLTDAQIEKTRTDLVKEYQTSAEFKSIIDGKVNQIILQKIKMGLISETDS
jgi:hypothetical protein